MKKYEINTYEAGIYLFTALSVGIFLAIPFGVGPELDTCRSILTIGILIYIFIFFISLKWTNNGAYSKRLNTYMSIYTIIMLFQIIRSIYIYEYSFNEIYYSIRQYIWVFLAYPILYLFIKYNSIEKIMSNVVKITLLSLFLRFLTWSLYKAFQISLFPKLLYEYGISWGRNGILRIDATPLISLVLIYEFYKYLDTNKKKFAFYSICSLLYVLLVSQTRMLFIGCGISITVMFLLKRRNRIKKCLLIICICCASIFSVILGCFDKILDYLDLSNGVIGLEYRYYEFQYYFSLIKDKWKLGTGILSVKNDITNSILYGNLDTTMYLDDLGIFGYFIEFGLLSILLYGVLYFIMLKVIIKCYKLGETNYAVLICGFLSYLLIVSIPLNLFGIQRIFSIPFILAIISFINIKIEKDKLRINGDK